MILQLFIKVLHLHIILKHFEQISLDKLYLYEHNLIPKNIKYMDLIQFRFKLNKEKLFF